GAGGPLPRARIARSAQRKSVRRGSGRGPAQHAQRAVAVVFHADQHQLVLLPLTSPPRFFGRRARLDLVAEREPLAAGPAPRLQLRHLFLRTAAQRTVVRVAPDLYLEAVGEHRDVAHLQADRMTERRGLDAPDVG